MFMRTFAVCVGSLLLSGCIAAPAPRVVSVDTNFDVEEAKRLLAPGPNTIKASALLRQAGGGVVTCAGNEVHMVPATAYAADRIRMLYGSSERGFTPMPTYSNPGITFSEEAPGYRETVRTTRCDAQGYFTFQNVGDGAYFVTTLVQWSVANRPEGGTLMQRVTVSGGEVREVVLTN